MTPALFEVTIPQLGVNDETATIVEWRAAAGSRVERGEVIATIETTKASFDLETEERGFFYPIVESGVRVPIRTVVALVLPEPNPSIVLEYRSSHPEVFSPKAQRGETAASDEHVLTANARRLVEEHGIDLGLLPKGRVIRERDVRVLVGAAVALPQAHGDPSRNVAVYGAAQGGLVVAEALELSGYNLAAFLDDAEELIGTTLNGVPVVPGRELGALAGKGIRAVATHIPTSDFRLHLRRRARSAGVEMINVIHPHAIVSPSVKMGEGNLIKAGAIIDTEVRLGDCCIIDNGAVIPHHNRIGSGCHIAPGACMGGDCEIGDNTVIGVGARIAPRLRIGKDVIIGVGANVVRDVPDHAVFEGAPGRLVGQRRPS
jgi:UDP-perosamine 4-acetyltransferase